MQTREKEPVWMSQIHSCGRRVFHHTIAFRGFSLVELLVVVAILVTLGGLVLATMRGHASDRVGTASRLLQSSLQGLRVKASARRTTTGMGFVPGGEGVTNRAFPIVRSGTLVRSEEVDKVNFFLEFRRRDVVPPIGDYEADDPAVVLVAALTGHKWEEWNQAGRFAPGAVRIRVPSGPTGEWYDLVPVENDGGSMVVSDGDWSVIRVKTPIQHQDLLPFPVVAAVNHNWAIATIDLEFVTEPEAFSAPLELSKGTVVDISWSSQSVQQLWSEEGGLTILFNPGGHLEAATGIYGPLHLLVSDAEDASQMDDIDAYNNTTGQRKPDGLPDVPRRRRSPIDPRNRYPKTIVSVIPQSGAVLTSPIDPTDLIDNVTGESGPDGLADDLFRFARNGAGGP